jgi:hypothetical protein
MVGDFRVFISRQIPIDRFTAAINGFVVPAVQVDVDDPPHRRESDRLVEERQGYR